MTPKRRYSIIHPLPEPGWPSREEARQSRLFSPLRLSAGIELSSRCWVPAMVPWRASEEGLVTRDNLEWYERFARGRPGVIVVEATGIRDIKSGPLLRIGDDRFIPGLRRLAERVREASGGQTRLFIQLIDFLRLNRRPTPERFFRRYLILRPSHLQRLARLQEDESWLLASPEEVREALLSLPREQRAAVLSRRDIEDLERGYRERVTDLELPHIRDLPGQLPELFAQAAVRARRAGLDGVELHFAHAYTMASFLSRKNSRTDGYGGSRSGRLRLPLEVIARVRERVGSDYCVGCRMLSDEIIEGGSRLADAMVYAKAFARAGLDFLSISRGGKFEDARQPRIGETVYPYTGPSGFECMPTARFDARGPFGRNLPETEAIRRALRAEGLLTPVVAAGGICSFRQAEAILRLGQADLVAAARQSLADPDWWLKMAEGRGASIRRCVYSNYCEGLDQRHKQVTCKLWDKLLESGPGVSLSRDGRRRLVAPPMNEGP